TDSAYRRPDQARPLPDTTMSTRGRPAVRTLPEAESCPSHLPPPLSRGTIRTNLALPCSSISISSSSASSAQRISLRDPPAHIQPPQVSALARRIGAGLSSSVAQPRQAE